MKLFFAILILQIQAHVTADVDPEISENVRRVHEGDIILTPEQEELFTKNGKPVGEQRQKRHAYRGTNYPTNTWGEKIVYFIDTHATDALKEAFRSAVKAWQQDTCINFEEDFTGKRNRRRL
ncbi:hypothetical protein Aduo_007944 [Ancylostoma duodenale]